MRMSRRQSLAALLMALLTTAPLLAGCGISVQSDERGHDANVDIRTPLGSVSVQANGDTLPDTGLAVHPGARRLRDREGDSANVNIEGGFFGVKVAVAKFEDDQEPQALVDFYKQEMAKYGPVVECRGNLDFGGGRDATPRCQERSSGERQLGVGHEEHHRVVSVKPRGNGTEFTLVHVQTQG